MSRLLIGLAIGAVLVAAAPPKKAKPPKAVVAAALPIGPGQALVQSKCSACHAIGIVTGAHKSKAQWEASVEQMIDRGAPVSDAEFDPVVAYLVKNFGTGK